MKFTGIHGEIYAKQIGLYFKHDLIFTRVHRHVKNREPNLT